MYQKVRLDAIKEILEKQGYVTVAHLSQILHYSTATINRDLNLLEKQGVLKRSYGGAEAVKSKGVPLPYRYDKMKSEKRHLCKAAAQYVKDGETIFIDATTTTQGIGKYLTDKKGITVITNNLALISFLSEYKIKAICPGGEISEAPYFLSGDITLETVTRYRADKLFFSVGSITEDGGFFSVYASIIRAMMRNSKSVFLLADHQKLTDEIPVLIGDFRSVDYVISDHEFSDKTKSAYPNVKFINVD